jgi:hypothetical protein
MQNNFEPKHLKKAKETLEKELQAVQVHQETIEVYKKKAFKVSLWQKFLALFKR